MPIKGIPPIKENKFNNYKICGKQGGLPFKDAKRPLKSSGANSALTCENGWLPCDPKGNPEFTYCYPVTGSF